MDSSSSFSMEGGGGKKHKKHKKEKDRGGDKYEGMCVELNNNLLLRYNM